PADTPCSFFLVLLCAVSRSFTRNTFLSNRTQGVCDSPSLPQENGQKSDGCHVPRLGCRSCRVMQIVATRFTMLSTHEFFGQPALLRTRRMNMPRLVWIATIVAFVLVAEQGIAKFH